MEDQYQTIRYKNGILQAIETLRVRKARPNSERICRYLKKNFGADVKNVLSDLKSMVNREYVIKVEYKGQTSYRNAEKWLSKSNHSLSQTILHSDEISKTICLAVLASKSCADLKSIHDYLTKHDKHTRLTRGNLLAVINRECDDGNLMELSSGRYFVRGRMRRLLEWESSESDSVKSEKCEPPSPSNTVKDNIVQTIVLDVVPSGTADSEEEKTRKRRLSTNELSCELELAKRQKPSLVKKTCSFCDSVKPSRKGKIEKLLQCDICLSAAHPSCMNYSPQLATRCFEYPWQCMECKKCTICNDSGNANMMLFCDSCDKGYHMACHTPKIQKAPTGTWVCNMCRYEVDDVSVQVISESTGTGSMVCSPTCSDDQSDKSEESLSDAAYWNIQDVVNFIEAVGFGKEASAFKDQEIDGKSLLLMKRNDVLTGLSIKLGPALKIYNRYIVKLQNGLSSDDLMP